MFIVFASQRKAFHNRRQLSAVEELRTLIVLIPRLRQHLPVVRRWRRLEHLREDGSRRNWEKIAKQIFAVQEVVGALVPVSLIHIRRRPGREHDGDHVVDGGEVLLPLPAVQHPPLPAPAAGAEPDHLLAALHLHDDPVVE